VFSTDTTVSRNSEILVRPDEPADCPPTNGYGTYLVLNETSRVTSGGVRQVRVQAKMRDIDGWFGVALGFASTAQLYRVVYRPVDSCFQLQRRSNGTTLNPGSGGDSVQVEQEIELRVTFGAARIAALLLDVASDTTIGVGFNVSIDSLSADALPPTIALYSSNNRNGVVYSAVKLFDMAQLANVVEPTPAPTPIPPTPVPPTPEPVSSLLLLLL
jgi:hypothetical protein